MRNKKTNMPEIEKDLANDEELDETLDIENGEAEADETTDEVDEESSDADVETDNEDDVEDEEEKEEEDDNAEPVVKDRLSKRDYIIGRQKAKLAKDKAKTESENESDELEGVTAADEEIISKVVAKRFAPIIEDSLAAGDEKEISEFLTENPDFKQFESKVRRFMKHPSRRALPIKSIFYEVGGDKLMKIGADRERAANKKAKDTKTGGEDVRAEKKGVWNMSPEEFKAEQDKVRRG